MSKPARKWKMWALVRDVTGVLLDTYPTHYAAGCGRIAWGGRCAIVKVEVREIKPTKKDK